MMILSQIDQQLAERMKSGDKFSTEVLRMLKSALTNASIAKPDHNLTADDEIEIIQREIKKRKQSMDLYTQGHRPELAAKEAKEVQFLEKFLPEQISDAELEKIVVDAIHKSGATQKSDAGKVMSLIMPQLKGKADGGKVMGIIQRELS